MLYLHANVITNFAELAPLGKFHGLRKLTLHGNPIENLPNYRAFVLLMVRVTFLFVKTL